MKNCLKVAIVKVALSKNTSLFPEVAEGVQERVNDGKLKANVVGAQKWSKPVKIKVKKQLN